MEWAIKRVVISRSRVSSNSSSLIAGLKRTKITDVVIPTSGPAAGLLDTDADDVLGDGATETEMGETDVTDEDSDGDEDMEADAGGGDAQVDFTAVPQWKLLPGL